MAKGGGGGGSTTTVQKADPWVGLQAPLQSLYGGAMDWYKGGGPQYYPGQTRAGTNGDIQTALNQGSQRAMQGNDPLLGPARDSLAQTAAGRPMGDNPGFAQMQNFGNGAYYGNNAALPAMSGMTSRGSTFGQFAAGDNVGNNPAQGYFNDAAGGKFLSDQTNPYLSQMYDSATRPMVQQFQNAIAPGIASQFSAAGRTGSGAHAAAFDNASQTLGRQLGDTSANLYGHAYDTERGLQQQAAGTLGSMNQAERGMQLQGAQGMAGMLGQMGSLFDNERGMQLRGAEDMGQQYGNERGLQQSAALAAPGFAQNSQNADFDRISKLMGVGQYRQNAEQQGIDDQRARFDYGQQLPLQNLQALNQLLQGGSAYATKSSSGSNQTDRNPFAGAIGGAAMTNALGSMFGVDAMGGPMGLLGGALLGGLFG